MPPAARVTDLHSCPKHGGGPVVPRGEPSVLIGFMPAARESDRAFCKDGDDIVLRGEASVLVGGLPAARLGDPTIHGGLVTAGCPTVLIGSSPQRATLEAAAAVGAPLCESCDEEDDDADEERADPERVGV
ncbi:PAAR domain-containing protein [Nannocystis radixulma]|uniref:PAAR domain-containing protein n=1 Tax=Nannocystis radixulma TaxID=2995305 RepID=A0ABT5B5A1_9BACT|nr:PAAR domain-containing protein [Nannocystis radixulma]MDC0669272.1 PAAR domain-containing protein [Nannocystis radixulma]